MKKHIQNIGLVTLISILIAVIVYIINPQLQLNVRFLFFAFVWAFIGSTFALVAWGLNVVLEHFFPWEKYKNRIWINIASFSIVLFFASVFISFAEYKLLENTSISFAWYWQNKKGVIFIYFFIAMAFTAFFHAKAFYENLVAGAVREQALLAEQKQAEINALKAQIDPHFLFNSLNVLKALIKQNPNKAEDFVDDLAGVYRYVLSSHQKDLVTLEEEIYFAKKYFNLLVKRFGNALQWQINTKTISQQKILPLSLQLAIENAVKHNALTIEKPLIINVQIKESQLIVKNNKQVKDVLHSNKMGLENLAKRYELQGKKININNQNDEFILTLPLF